MKYTVNGNRRTTEDGRYTIIKDYACGYYTIRDNEARKDLYCNQYDKMVFAKLEYAKKYLENLYK